MANEEQKTGEMAVSRIFRSFVAFAIGVVICATPSLARQMECSYDYITHMTTLQLDDLGAPDRSISYSFSHSVSPQGGEDMFLFSGRDPAILRGTGKLEFIMGKLFFDPLATISAIEFVDFDRPTLKQLQAPTAYLERSTDSMSAPLVVWSCHRTD